MYIDKQTHGWSTSYLGKEWLTELAVTVHYELTANRHQRP